MKKKLFHTMIASVLFMIPVQVFAHVGYMLPEEQISALSGQHKEILLAPFQNPIYVILMITVALLFVGAVAKLSRAPFIKRIQKNLETKEVDYQRIFPWAIRMSLGIALIGAGTMDVLISPIVSNQSAFGFLQTLIGFLLLTGFLLELAIVLAALLYVYALVLEPYMLGNLDFLALAVAFLLIGDDRPGIDDLLNIPCYCFLKKMNDFLPLILRIGIGISMIFLAVYEKFLMPAASMQVVTDFGLMNIIPVSPEMWVLSTGIIELVIGIALLLGLFTRLSAAIAFFVLSLSFFFFGEDVYSHVTLFGTLSILFVTGGNKWSLDHALEKLRKKKKR